jgi:hypothetical protein
MKKFIAAFDGLRFSTSARDYAIQLARQSSAHLVGVFLDDFSYNSFRIYDLMKEEGGYSEVKHRKLEEKDAATRKAAVEKFESACRYAGIPYSVHHDRNIAIQELLHESIYCDLLIIDAGETLKHYREKVPTEFIRELLTHVQCPVLVTPRVFRPIDQMVLLFDGEPSAVHAIKMLSYTLASLKQYPAEVISVKTGKQSLHVPDNKLMKEFMKRHFPRATYTVLKGMAEDEILTALKAKHGNTIIVLGAYRRGMVSRWFRESMADVLMREQRFPLFIAHNK